jgi:hypothetical protein
VTFCSASASHPRIEVTTQRKVSVIKQSTNLINPIGISLLRLQWKTREKTKYVGKNQNGGLHETYNHTYVEEVNFEIQKSRQVTYV